MALLKHIDFQPADWGELAKGPQPIGTDPGSVVLGQSAAAAFPDRTDAGSSCGLLATLVPGAGGQYVEHILPAAEPILHTRVMVGWSTCHSGLLTLLRGLNEAGQVAFSLTLDCASGALAVHLATGQTLAGALPLALPWNCVEVRLDAAGGHAELWVNGISVVTRSGDLAGWAVRTLQLGVLEKSPTATGEIHLAHWIIASGTDGYIGPQVVPARSPYADDPAAWLVVYNAANTDSSAWADYYRQARGIPLANLCGLDLPADETISLEQFAVLENGIAQYLDTNGLGGQVLGIVLGFGVPGYVDGPLGVDAVAALFHVSGSVPGAVQNPLALADPIFRPDKAALGTLRLTARIDAPDLAQAKAIVDRASALMNEGLGQGSAAGIWLDPVTPHDPELAPFVDTMTQWAASVERMRTRLPLHVTTGNDSQTEVQFATIECDGFFWGWSSTQPPMGFFGAPAGQRVFCLQMGFASATASTLRAAVSTNWVQGALAAGYAAAAGSSRPYSTSVLPDIAHFFSALRQGWTLAEAWLMACPVLREGLFLAGDPLLRVAMPAAGWDLYGPLQRLEDLDPATPAASLRADESSLALTDDGPGALQPADGSQGLYVLRHVDPDHQSAAPLRTLRVANVAGSAAPPPLPPVWPCGPAWRVRIEEGQLRLLAVWDQPIARCRVAQIHLLSQAEGENAVVVASIKPNPHQRWVGLPRELPTAPTRFRWRILSSDGAVVETDWSAPVMPAPSAGVSLTPVEVRS